MNITLRPYQQSIVDSCRQAYKQGYKAPLVVAPTGSGKTIIFSYITHNANLKNNKVLNVVHREELLKQTSKALDRFGVPHGLFAAGYPQDKKATTVVASIQTLVSRIEQYIKTYGEPDFIIMDEAHHARASQWEFIIKTFPNAKILGVTATPQRADGKGLGVGYGGFFDAMVLGPDINWLIANKYLVPPIVYSVKDDLKQGALAGDVVGKWRKYAKNTPTVVFCKSVQHSKDIANLFSMCGIKAAYVDGSMDKEQRAANINGLADGSVQVLTSCDVISEGVDVPAIGCIIMLRKLTSLVTYLQQVGRALRISDGKEEAIVLDCVGNTLNFGFVTDEWNWSLKGDAERKKKVAPGEAAKECNNCYAYYKTSLNACPRCGAVPPPPKVKKIQYVDAELVLMTKIEQEQKDAQKKRELKEARTLEQLRAYARKYGLNEKWAEHYYRGRQIAYQKYAKK